MLEIRDLFVSYEGTPILRAISLKIDEGEFVSILGPNGAGKSTLLKAIAGLLKPDKGKILFEGRSIAGLHPAKLVEQGILFLPQGSRVFPHLTVEENLEVMLYRFRRKKRKELIENIFLLFSILTERRKVLAGRLSGGEQQMVALARAMVMRPKLLLLDEPSLGLSPSWINIVFEKIGEIHHMGTTIILVEQKVKEALQMAQKGYTLRFGKVALMGSYPG